MTTSTATSTGELTLFWLADRFSEIERRDMRVVEVRVRRFPRRLMNDCVDFVGGRRCVWRARLVEDQTMKAGVVVFRYEKLSAVTFRARTGVYSRRRTIR